MENDDKDFDLIGYDYGEKPVGYLKFINIGKLPNRFQRFMIKKIFGIEIIVGKKEKKDGI